MDKYKNIYRIPSARADWWDYARDAAYFITICTFERECYFGDIQYGEMKLSEIGEIARTYWAEIPQHFSFAQLDAFIVMPNHVHGIVVIDQEHAPPTGDAPKGDTMNKDAINRVSTNAEAPELPARPSGGFAKEKNPMLNENLARIIRWYKGRTTFESRKIHAAFAWQSRFHDHIIRNRQSLETITEYIVNNPSNWKEDKFYKS